MKGSTTYQERRLLLIEYQTERAKRSIQGDSGQLIWTIPCGIINGIAQYASSSKTILVITDPPFGDLVQVFRILRLFLCLAYGSC